MHKIILTFIQLYWNCVYNELHECNSGLGDIFRWNIHLHSWYQFLVMGDPMCQVEVFITSSRLPADTIVSQALNATNTAVEECAIVQTLDDDLTFQFVVVLDFFRNFYSVNMGIVQVKNWIIKTCLDNFFASFNRCVWYSNPNLHYDCTVTYLSFSSIQMKHKTLIGACTILKTFSYSVTK